MKKSSFLYKKLPNLQFFIDFTLMKHSCFPKVLKSLAPSQTAYKEGRYAARISIYTDKMWRGSVTVMMNFPKIKVGFKMSPLYHSKRFLTIFIENRVGYFLPCPTPHQIPPCDKVWKVCLGFKANCKLTLRSPKLQVIIHWLASPLSMHWTWLVSLISPQVKYLRFTFYV